MVHTDAWQVIVMFISVVVCTGMGTYIIGGYGNVFSRASEGERLNLFKLVI